MAQRRIIQFGAWFVYSYSSTLGLVLLVYGVFFPLFSFSPIHLNSQFFHYHCQWKLLHALEDEMQNQHMNSFER